MLKILVNAYACSPHTGSEPGMAWNWCINLAKHCELHIITEGEFREYIEEGLKELPQSQNLHFYFNPVSEGIRKMCWNQGDWRFYKHYKKWQYKTYEMAVEICQNENIDILHQLNMIGFREPGYLWKITNRPFIWGPVDAKEKYPIEYLQGLSWKIKFTIYIKNFLNSLQLRYSSRVRKAVNRADFVLSASSNSRETFKNIFNIDAPLLNETGCNINTNIIESTRKSTVKLELLWIGKFDFRKQLELALRSLSKTANKNIKINIVGGISTPFLNLIEELGISDQCHWHGIIPHNEVQTLMQQNDLLFFTSVAEGTPHVVLEAISNNLPILCFNTCGQGDSVNEEIGLKIELSSPRQSIIEFSEKLNYLYKNRAHLINLSQNCKKRQLELSWEEKSKTMISFYQKSLEKYN